MEFESLKKLNGSFSEMLIDSLKENKEVLDMLSGKGLDSKAIDSNAIAINNWLKGKKICDNCKGLSMCTKEIKGYYEGLDQNLLAVLKSCHYKKENDAILAHKKNYLLCDLNDADLENDINKIDLRNESGKYVQLVSLIKDWLNNPGNKKGLYLHGYVGVGKTFLASCIANKWAKDGKKVVFVKQANLASLIKNNRDESGFIQGLVNDMKRADLLVLDDIGAEKMSDSFRDDILFVVLDHRMDYHKMTIFTSNSDLNSLKARLMNSNTEDETKALRIIERIRTLSAAIFMEGGSRRK